MFARLPDSANTLLKRSLCYNSTAGSLTHRSASVCIARVKWLLLISAVVASASCTTLENRRDLYRSPAEGYERWHRHPPPTRLPSTGPASRAAVPVSEPPLQQHGVISFPDEPGLPAEEGR
jgi:hypothetical protein